MKIVVFGTGSTAEKVLKIINQNVKILCFSDNNKEKWEKEWNGYKIISPDRINEYDYDYILVCSMFTSEIIDSLIRRGVNRSKIIPYFNNIDYKKQVEKEVKLKKIILKQKKGNKIALITRRNSGCNCIALFKNIPDFISKEFTVELVTLNEFKDNPNQYDVVFSTHFEGRFHKSRINIETWHGFPIKSVGVFEKNCIDNLNGVDQGIDHIISYSNLYNYVMNSAFDIDVNKFIKTGMPRNDLLINDNSRTLISKIIQKDIIGKKIIFYVPTFRKRTAKKVRDGEELFTDYEELSLIDSVMEELNAYFLIKKHPVEGDSIEHNYFQNIFFIDDSDFKKLDIDFYEVLGGSDMLITDYSSVYFDYLLLNKPIIFWTKDHEMYEENRGFLFDNIENLMPGPIANRAIELVEMIKEFINNGNWYSDQRMVIKKLVHFYDDFNSCERIWKLFQENIYHTW